MKKLLLSLLCLCGLAVANAGETTLVINECVQNPTVTDSEFTGFRSGDFYIECDQAEGATHPAYNKGGDLRLYAGNVLTVNCTSAMTKIVFNLSAQGQKRLGEITANVGTIAAQALGDTQVTWTGNAQSVQFTVGEQAIYGSDGESKKAQFDFLSMVITADATGGEPVVTPTDEYASLGAWLAAQNAGNARINAPLTVVYQNGLDLYVTEGNAWVLVYGTLTQTYKNGDVIPAGVEGSYKDYNGQPELLPVASTFGAATTGTPVSPAVKDIPEVTLDLLSQYIRVEGVTLSPDSENERLFHATADGQSLDVWNRWKLEFETGTDATIYGIVGVNNGVPQLYPVKVEIEGEVNPDEPDEPDVPEPVEGMVFDYTNPGSLSPAQATPEVGGETVIAGITFTAGNVTMVTNVGESTSTAQPRIYNSSGTLSFRTYVDNVSTFASDANITRIEMVCNYSSMPGCATADSGSFDAETGLIWTGSAKQVNFTWHKYTYNDKEYNPQVFQFVVTTEGALDSIEADNTNAPVEYFNLQGVRVANPENGIFVRRQGSSVTKVVR